ncbi:MAG TPA: 7-cyano-7-deazaguanine synthase QueC [Nitrospiraceae bacterium]|jgi:7-cyano-7-deazaguanine synthase|nr:7-cyano-7-deazaguanine synthase QueC [Nitrospiraceae bacterium]
MKAVVLASGGVDSTVTAAVARRDGCQLYFLTIAYGQRHRVEVERARSIAEAVGAVDHVVLDVDLRAMGGSALTGDQSVPKDRSEAARAQSIPSTYVPARNTIFLSLALAYAETRGAEAIYIGANVIDYSGYPDCRPEFLRAFEEAARLGTRTGSEGRPVQIRAPLLRMSKSEIIRLGAGLGVPFELTHSCYDPTAAAEACGRCDSCRIRLEGFRAAGLVDPILYVEV